MTGPSLAFLRALHAGLAGTRDEGGEVLALAEPEGQQLHVDERGRGFLASASPDVTTGASLSGAAPRYSHAAPPAVASAPAPKAERKMTNDELAAEADRMLAGIQAQKQAALERGPAVTGNVAQPAPWLTAYMAGARAEGGMIGPEPPPPGMSAMPPPEPAMTPAPNPLSPDGLVFGAGGTPMFAPQPQNLPPTYADVGTPPLVPPPAAAPPATPPVEGAPGTKTSAEMFAEREAERARAAAASANKSAAVAETAATPAQNFAPPPPPGAAPAPELPPDVQFASVGSSGHPAGEARVRGPQQEGHLLASLEGPAAAALSADERNQRIAAREQELYDAQAEDSLRQQEAAQRVLARRQQELAAMEADYHDSVDRLGQASLNTNRWWANKSTPEKIGVAALMFLGGVASFGTGQPNPVAQRMMKEIDGDVDAQKFDYDVGLTQAKEKQNAFAMMMQRYGSEDAARAAARAAGIDAAMAKIRSLAAMNKGVESANQADALLGQLSEMRQRILAEGFKFVPAAAGGQRYALSVRGQLLPGTVSEAEAQRIMLEHGVKPGEQADQAMIQIGGKLLEKNAEQQQKQKQNLVQLPTGEVVTAPTEQEAGKLREGVIAMQRTKALVKRAREIRDSSVFRVDPSARAELHQIQANLLTDYGVAHQLGALSNADYAIAQSGTAGLFDFTGTDRQLDSLDAASSKAIRDRVKSYAGGSESAPRAAGAMPASFTPHRGK